jgi:hypothetical protein
MPIAVKCECGQLFRVPEQFAGKRGKCPVCARVVAVPGRPAVTPAPSSPAPPAAVKDPRPAAKAAPPRSRNWRWSRTGRFWKSRR